MGLPIGTEFHAKVNFEAEVEWEGVKRPTSYADGMSYTVVSQELGEQAEQWLQERKIGLGRLSYVQIKGQGG